MAKRFDPAHAAANGYTRDDWDAVDSPELTSDDVARLRPASEAMPDLHAALVAARASGPVPKTTAVSIRLDDDVLAKLRASGPGWQSRVNDAVRQMVDGGKAG